MYSNLSKCTVPAKGPVPNNSLTVIILSAGVGRRMKGRGAKALLTMHTGTTILEYQIKTILKMYPSADIIVATGFQADKIRNLFRGVYPVRFVFNPFFETSNVMYSTALALECAISPNIIIMHGDILFNSVAIADIIGTISKILVLPETYPLNDREVGAVIQANQVTNLSYGIPRSWGQLAYLTGRELKLFEQIAFNHETSSNWFLYEGLNRTISCGGKFVCHSPSTMHFIEIDKAEDMERLKGITL